MTVVGFSLLMSFLFLLIIILIVCCCCFLCGAKSQNETEDEIDKPANKSTLQNESFDSSEGDKPLLDQMNNPKGERNAMLDNITEQDTQVRIEEESK